MTPPAKGRPRQPVPREVRADGQAGALLPHGWRQTYIINTRNNIPPPNLRSPMTKGDRNSISNANNKARIIPPTPPTK